MISLQKNSLQLDLHVKSYKSLKLHVFFYTSYSDLFCLDGIRNKQGHVAAPVWLIPS